MELIVATRNPGKLREFARILSPLGITVSSQEQHCPGLEVDETGTTFAENARLKAQAIYEATGKPTVADDSGLCVDALDGAPGVYSARYGGPGLSDAQRVQKLLQALENTPKPLRTGRFVSAICCVLGPGQMIECQGMCEGWIGYEPLGENGFGYDPVFMVGDQSFAQMSDAQKDSLSHRGKALELFYKEMNAILR